MEHEDLIRAEAAFAADPTFEHLQHLNEVREALRQKAIAGMVQWMLTKH